MKILSKKELQIIYNGFSFSAISIAIMVLLSSIYEVTLIEWSIILTLFSSLLILYRHISQDSNP